MVWALALVLWGWVMADQLTPQELISALNYLGHGVSVPVAGGQGLQGSASGGALPAPTGSPAPSGGMGVQIGAPGGQSAGGFNPVGLGVDAIQRLSSLFNQGPDQTRGDVGGSSLSDQLRGSPTPSATSGFTNVLPGNVPNAQALSADTGSMDLSPEFLGLVDPEAVQSTGAVAPAVGGGVDALASQGMLGLLAAPFIGGTVAGLENIAGLDTQMDRAQRQPSVAQGIRGDLANVPTVLRQIAAGAIDPSTLAGMSPQQQEQAFINALNAYGASSSLAAPFSTSGKKEAGLRHPDFSQVEQAAGQLEPVAFFDMVAAYDAIGGRAPQGLSFPEALHALQGEANLPVLPGGQNLNATAAFDPYYNQGGLQSPQDFLAGLGADPGLAGQLAPMMQGVQPGQYLERLNQIFGTLNPDVGSSQFGSLLASLGVQPEAPAASPVPEGTTPAGLLAASQGGDVGGLDIGAGATTDSEQLRKQLGTP